MKIKPCPFCGSEADEPYEIKIDGKIIEYQGVCMNGACRASGPWAKTAKKAIMLWNQRCFEIKHKMSWHEAIEYCLDNPNEEVVEVSTASKEPVHVYWHTGISWGSRLYSGKVISENHGLCPICRTRFDFFKLSLWKQECA
jgi:Lar family restriction alleviation protein